MPRRQVLPVANYHTQLTALLARFGLQRNATFTSFSALSLERVTILQGILNSLLHRSHHVHDYDYQIAPATQQEISSLINHCIRRSIEIRVSTLFSTFGFIHHDANLFLLDAYAIEQFHDMLHPLMDEININRDIIPHTMAAYLQALWEGCLDILDAGVEIPTCKFSSFISSFLLLLILYNRNICH